MHHLTYFHIYVLCARDPRLGMQKKKKTKKTVFDQPLVESTNMKGADIKGQLYLLGNTKNKKRV